MPATNAAKGPFEGALAGEPRRTGAGTSSVVGIRFLVSLRGGDAGVSFLLVQSIRLRIMIASVIKMSQMIEDAAEGHLYVKVPE